MRIYCFECGALVGDILKGSKLQKGLIFTCGKCKENKGILRHAGKYNHTEFEKLFKGIFK